MGPRRVLLSSAAEVRLSRGPAARAYGTRIPGYRGSFTGYPYAPAHALCAHSKHIETCCPLFWLVYCALFIVPYLVYLNDRYFECYDPSLPVLQSVSKEKLQVELVFIGYRQDAAGRITAMPVRATARGVEASRERGVK